MSLGINNPPHDSDNIFRNRVIIQVFEEFESLVPADELRMRAERTLEVSLGTTNAEVSIVISGDDDVRELNKRYRGLDETTDVLSFSYNHHGQYYGKRKEPYNLPTTNEFILPPGENISLGEVIISYPQAQRQASRAGHPVDTELEVLVTHGILHLLGYDHESPTDQLEMERVQTKVLTDLETKVCR